MTDDIPTRQRCKYTNSAGLQCLAETSSPKAMRQHVHAGDHHFSTKAEDRIPIPGPWFEGVTRCEARDAIERRQCLVQTNLASVMQDHKHVFMMKEDTLPYLHPASTERVRDRLSPPASPSSTPRGVGQSATVRSMYLDTRAKLYQLLADTANKEMSRPQVTRMNDLQNRLEALITLRKTDSSSISFQNDKDVTP